MQAPTIDFSLRSGTRLTIGFIATALVITAIVASAGIVQAGDEDQHAAIQSPNYQSYAEIRFVEQNVLFPAHVDQVLDDEPVVGAASSTWEQDWAAGIGDESFIPRRSILTHPWGGDALYPEW